MSRLARVGVQQVNAIGIPEGAAMQFNRAQADLTAALHLLTTRGRKAHREAFRLVSGTVAACEMLRVWLNGGRM